MSLGEFELISTYFKSDFEIDSVSVGIGDDGAVLKSNSKEELIVTTDTLVADIHFPSSTSPEDIAYKAIAVNLSDLAAMGAKPLWLSLSIAMPNADRAWLKAFSQEFMQYCRASNIALVGGDTTRSPQLVVTVTAHGSVPKGGALLRSNANVGDDIYVTGTLGDASAGLSLLQNKKLNEENLDPELRAWLIGRLNRPQARIAVGSKLRGVASAAIDISDGLLADLNHILTASSCGAEIDVDSIPLSYAIKSSFSTDNALKFALAGGDDYELCFTAPRDKQKLVAATAEATNCPVTCIGTVVSGSGISLKRNREAWTFNNSGYEHFKHD